jgi:hypothetical protein
MGPEKAYSAAVVGMVETLKILAALATRVALLRSTTLVDRLGGERHLRLEVDQDERAAGRGQQRPSRRRHCGRHIRFPLPARQMTLNERGRCPTRRRRPECSKHKRFEVLHDGGEMEFVTRAGKSSEPHALEAVVNLQVREAHLDTLSFVSRYARVNRKPLALDEAHHHRGYDDALD